MARLADLKDDFEIAPEGTYTATLTRFVDLGRHKTQFGNSRMLSLCFELADVTTSDNKPMLVFKTLFNYSTRSKTLRDLLRVLSGLHDVRDVDPRGLRGITCQGDVTHRITNDGSTYADIEVKRGKPGAKKPKVKSDVLYFSLLPGDFKQEELDKLSDRQREKIKASDTYRATLDAIKLKNTSTAEFIDDEIPDFDALAAKRPTKDPGAKSPDGA